MRWNTLHITFVTFFFFTSCVEVIELEQKSLNTKLVIDGIFSDKEINHIISLSATISLNEFESNPVTNANLVIRSKDNTQVIELTELEPGKYATPIVAGVIGKFYRLEISLNNGEVYYSNYEEMLSPLPIDSIYADYTTNDDGLKGLQISLDAYNDTEMNRYYYWNWVETYEITPPFPSLYEWNGEEPILRNEQISVCWNSNTSDKIFIKTTANSSNNNIEQFPLKFISENESLLNKNYSLLVNQYSINREAYFYWSSINEIISSQGSFSDIQLGNVIGNISTEDGKNAIGYFMVASHFELREFWPSNEVLLLGFKFRNYYPDCNARVILPKIEDGQTLEQALALFMNQGQNSDFYYIHDGPDFGGGWAVVPRYCGDCRVSGTNIKPNFWP